MRRPLAACLVWTALCTSSIIEGDEPPDYLKIVRSYADAMIAHGRDIYGSEPSPLFAEALDRGTMRLLEGEALENVEAIPRELWGVRPHDRMLAGGNPQHCENLYQVLYALADFTGESRYANEADRSLAFFLKHCQSPATGLFWWGEHAGWDFRTEKPIDKPSGKTHEFYRPWLLWERSWPLAPESCRRFALGLWEHQIGDQTTGDFSRHAAIDSHGPGTEAPYARHGGFYIETWATAYEKTKDNVFLDAILTVLDGLERARLHEGGYLTGGSKRQGGRRNYDLSLAVSLGNAAAKTPTEVAGRLREVAATNDDIFAKAYGGSGGGNLWSNAYGGSPLAGQANVWMLRYRQVKRDVYRRAVLEAADLYLQREITLGEPLWPGTMGSAIHLMLNAYELSGEQKYLGGAADFAEKGLRFFLDDNCPLPKASHLHDHYEAVTNGDTFMLALLRLWQIRHRPQAKLPLFDCDR
ncbi:MAG: hypothetical protein GXY83_21755 [Rhodopirellula sp.]|nr:hypothetical protein [Rhodopirellula sp.]